MQIVKFDACTNNTTIACIHAQELYSHVKVTSAS